MLLNKIEVDVLEKIDFKSKSIGFNLKRYNKNSCIYCIFNKINGKFYLGSTINFKTRINTHRIQCKRNIHHSIKFQRAYKKYGEDSFVVYILEYVDNHNIKEREEYYLNLLKPYESEIGYNISKFYISASDRIVTQETKNKIKLALTGRKLSKEHADKVRKANLGKFANPLTNKRIVSIVQLSNGTIINTFHSITEASRITKTNRSSIANVLCNRAKTANKYEWKYLN